LDPAELKNRERRKLNYDQDKGGCTKQCQELIASSRSGRYVFLINIDLRPARMHVLGPNNKSKSNVPLAIERLSWRKVRLMLQAEPTTELPEETF
jgi:hypothetical protein